MPTAIGNVIPTYRCKGDPLIIHFPEAASQTFVKGDFVTLSSGKVARLLAAGNHTTAGDRGTGTMILGIALADATGVTDTDVPVVVADCRTDFKLQLCTTDAAQAFAQSQVGTPYALRTISTTGYWGVNVNVTAANQQVIVREPVLDNKTDTVGLVWAVVRTGAQQGCS